MKKVLHISNKKDKIVKKAAGNGLFICPECAIVTDKRRPGACLKSAGMNFQIRSLYRRSCVGGRKRRHD